MAKATTFDVIDSLQSLLEDNLTDPNPDRRNNDTRWIYTIPINFDLAEFPRIHIQDVSSTHEGLSIGSTERWIESRIQVSIFMGVGDGNKMDIDGDGEKERPREILDDIAEEVVDQINDNQSRWRDIGTEDNVFNVLTVEENRLQDDRNSVLQHNIDAFVRHAR